jgi:hypothetical protein
MKYLPLLLGLAAAWPLWASSSLPLQDVIPLPSQQLAPEKSITLDLPPLPAKAEQVLVLSFRAFVQAAGPGGCNWNASVAVNDIALTRFTESGAERLLARPQLLELRPGNLSFSVIGGDRLMIMYAKDADQADTMTSDNLGGTFNLDISDLTRGVDGNTIKLISCFKGPADENKGALVVQDLRVGYLPRAKLPQTSAQIPVRGAVTERIKVGEMELAQGRSGGFVVKAADGPELLVETALGMKPDTLPVMLAQDAPAAGDSEPAGGPQVQGRKVGPAGFELTATWPQVKLLRTLEIKDGLVYWRETWTNTGAETIGVPLRHRMFLREGGGRFTVGGSLDNVALASSAANPTLFVEPNLKPGSGYGLTAESDWWRLLSSLRAMGHIGEAYTNTLALAAGKSLELEMTITPVGIGGGYWQFINHLRQRWGINGPTMERPMFWGYARRPEITDPVEQAKASLGHLGPVMVVLSPWQRLEPDAKVVRAGRYPKLPPEAPRTPGLCPDLDVKAFLTFKHREPYWEDLLARVRNLRQAIPGIKLIQMTHPAMEAVYRPLEDQWPIAADAIKTPQGQTFESSGYSKAWLGDMMNKDWGVLYYVPRPDSVQMRDFIREAEKAMDEAPLDGMYSDEFSWAFTSRGYSRYDYSRWDGYSADLDENGKVVALKTDGGMVTEACQLAMINACNTRGKFFLGNGSSCLRSVQSLPHHRFIEGGNGPSWYGQGHLSAVPMLLGNMGDETTTAGVFASVRKCLQYGALYSPVGVNLLLEGDTNFVSKLYPMTIVAIGPGFVVGKERIATTVTRLFDWPGVSGRAKVYRYDKDGTRVDAEAEITVTAGQPVAVEVPAGGLIIVERI